MSDLIRAAFEEGFAASKMNGPIETAWERSEARQQAAPDFSHEIDEALTAIGYELEQARLAHGARFASMHEAKAVIEEELEEFWEEVRKKKAERSEPHMRYELTQLAAMAVKAMLQLKRGTV